MTCAWSMPRSPAPQALPVIGIRSANARPSFTRLDAHAPDSPDTCFTYCVVDAAPSTLNAPDRSARSISRHVSSSPCRTAANTSGSTSVARTPDVSAETAAASSPSSA